MRVTVLGAGAMGSAICRPLADAGCQVRLWGTWLDDDLLDAVDAGLPHPRTQVRLASGVRTYRSSRLPEALEGAQVVVLAVASPGVEQVTRLALSGISQAEALWLTSKGFLTDVEGGVRLLPEAVRAIAASTGVPLPPIVAIAGPVKANECAAALPTATVFGCLDLESARRFAQEARTSDYAIAVTDDEVGVEVCAPMKNVYAIALGVADGLEEATGRPRHNLKAAIFTQAVKEMSLLGQALGGRPETAYGLPGVGDLEVTGLSGRNKIYGQRIGRGEPPSEALAEMARLGQTVEGASAVEPARALVAQRVPGLVEELPLLNRVAALLAGDSECLEEAFATAVLPISATTSGRDE